jgi:hypothetical protein
MYFMNAIEGKDSRRGIDTASGSRKYRLSGRICGPGFHENAATGMAHGLIPFMKTSCL